MLRLVVLLSVAASLTAAPLAVSAAQDSTPPPKPADSTHADSAPPPPTPDQQKWMQGLRTAARGIGQIKSGIDGVQRAGTNPTQLKRAGKLLAGFCGTGRGFMHTGVARMPSAAYDGDNRKIARQVVIQIDSVAKATSACEQQAARDPKTSVEHLLPFIQSYEAAIGAWRAMVGLPPLPTHATKP